MNYVFRGNWMIATSDYLVIVGETYDSGTSTSQDSVIYSLDGVNWTSLTGIGAVGNQLVRIR